MSDKPTPDVVRWYTRARRFPQLIGRTPDGARLWGGPYTITQAVGAGVTLVVGLNTMWLWAGFGFVGNLLVLGVVTYGVVFALGRIPVGSRSPLSVLTGVYKAIAAPSHGRLAGRPVRIRRPHRLQHAVVIRHEPTVTIPAAAPDAAPPVVEAPAPAPIPPAPPIPAPPTPALTPTAPLSGVQSLLAGAGPARAAHSRPRSETP